MSLTLEQAKQAHPLNDRILVHLPQLLPDTLGTGLTDADGQPVTLLFDASFRPEENRCIMGRCVVPARQLTRAQSLFARPTASNPNKVVWLDDCLNDVSWDDEVVIDYSALEADNLVGPGLYYVPFNLLIAVIRRGEPRPVGGYVLLRPVQEVEVPNAGQRLGVPGSKLLPNLGRVAHLGTPLRRTAVLDPVQVGELVYFQQGYAFPNLINGRLYYCVRHDYLLGAAPCPVQPMAAFFPTLPYFMDLSTLRVQGNRLLVKPITDTAPADGPALLTPHASQKKPQTAEVLAVGPGTLCENGQTVPVGIGRGDTVQFPSHAGTEVEIDGVKLLYLRATEVYAAW